MKTTRAAEDVQVRISAVVYETVKTLAKKEGRTIKGQIERLMLASLEGKK